MQVNLNDDGTRSLLVDVVFENEFFIASKITLKDKGVKKVIKGKMRKARTYEGLFRKLYNEFKENNNGN